MTELVTHIKKEQINLIPLEGADGELALFSRDINHLSSMRWYTFMRYTPSFGVSWLQKE
jgi:hypothetical protein